MNSNVTKIGPAPQRPCSASPYHQATRLALFRHCSQALLQAFYSSCCGSIVNRLSAHHESISFR